MALLSSLKEVEEKALQDPDGMPRIRPHGSGAAGILPVKITLDAGKLAIIVKICKVIIAAFVAVAMVVAPELIHAIAYV